MQLTEGDLRAWAATAQVLENGDADEIEFLPDFAAAVHAPSATIGTVPGAFNVDAADLSSAAIAVFSVAMACIKYMAPKLFDATVDLGKDAFKRALERRTAKAAPAAHTVSSVDAARIHEFVRRIAIERRLSEATATHIANAVVAHMAMSSSD